MPATGPPFYCIQKGLYDFKCKIDRGMSPFSLTRAVQSRLAYAVFSGFKAMATSFARTVYVMWLEMTGLAFAAFAVAGASAFVRQYRMQGWVTDKHRFWATIGFTLVAGFFAVTSFVRARTTRKK